jgi:conjugal transfer/type IV secretion protein DotA/TraY
METRFNGKRLLAIAALIFVCLASMYHPESSAQGMVDDCSKEKEQSIICEMLGESDDNMLKAMVDKLFGGGTRDNQKSSLLGEFSRGYLDVLKWAILLILMYRFVMYAIRTGLDGESGGQQQANVSPFWTLTLPSLTLALLMPLSSGYSYSQYGVHTLLTQGITWADSLAITGVRFMAADTSTGGDLKDYLDKTTAKRSGALIDKGVSAEIFRAAVLSDTCMKVMNSTVFKDSEKKIELVETRIKEPGILTSLSEFLSSESDDKKDDTSKNVAVFSYELTPDPSISEDEFNMFCGQITLTRGELGDKKILDTSKMAAEIANPTLPTSEKKQFAILASLESTKFSQDAEAMSTLLKDIARVNSSQDWEPRPPMETDKLEGEIETLTRNLQQLSELGSSPESIEQAQERLNAVIDEIARAKAEITNQENYLFGKANQYQNIKNKYSEAIERSASTAVARYKGISSGGVSIEKELEDRGIIVLGSLYWSLAQIAERIREAAAQDVKVSGPTFANGEGDAFEEIIDHSIVLTSLGQNLEAATKYDPDSIKSILGSHGNSVRTIAADGSISYENDNILWDAPAVGAAVAWGVKQAFSSTDLVINIHRLGTWMGGLGYSLIAVAAAPIALDKIKRIGLKDKLTHNKSQSGGVFANATNNLATKFITKAMEGVTWLAKTFGLPLLLVGGFATYYIPSIPALYWFMSLFGMLIIFLEALFVIPVWLVLLNITSGREGWENQHFRMGLVMLVGLVIRLPLSVGVFFGIIMLLNLANIFVTLMLSVYMGLAPNGVMGPIGWLFMMAGVIFFAYQLVIRAFSLMTDLVDRMMEGLNLGRQTFGQQGDEEKGRTLVLANIRAAREYAGKRGLSF